MLVSTRIFSFCMSSPPFRRIIATDESKYSSVEGGAVRRVVPSVPDTTLGSPCNYRQHIHKITGKTDWQKPAKDVTRSHGVCYYGLVSIES